MVVLVWLVVDVVVVVDVSQYLYYDIKHWVMYVSEGQEVCVCYILSLQPD